jgi:hypothetical protein
MPTFAIGGRPVLTSTPTVQVDNLAAGPHVFQLVVVDDSGNASKPASVTVNVVSPIRPVTRPPIIVAPPKF